VGPYEGENSVSPSARAGSGAWIGDEEAAVLNHLPAKPARRRSQLRVQNNTPFGSDISFLKTST
jgi:hypothetical protein